MIDLTKRIFHRCATLKIRMHKVLPLLIGRSSPSAGIAANPGDLGRDLACQGQLRSGQVVMAVKNTGSASSDSKSSLQSHAFDARSTIRAIEPGNGGVP